MISSLDLYRVFHQVVVSGSVSEAAKQLFITQPAVSQSIKQLEEFHGVRLFARLARGMALTGEGRRLSFFVKQALDLLEAGERELRDMAVLQAGELYIAAGDTLCRYFLLPFLERYHAAHPGIRLRITNRTSTETMELLRKGIVHIGVVNMPCNVRGIETEAVGTITDCLVTNDRELASHQYDYRTAADLPLLLLEQGTVTRKFLDAQFARYGVVLKPEFELGSIDLLVEFARIGLGVSAVVREFIEGELEAGTLFEVPLEPRLPGRRIGVAFRSGEALSPAADELLCMLKVGIQNPGAA